MAWKSAIKLDLLQTEGRQTQVVDGQKILFIWHQEKIHAVQAQCSHFKLPLSKGEVTDKCSIICPFHKSEFDLNTGKVQCWSPWPKAVGNLLGKIVKPKPLKVYETQVIEGMVFVNLGAGELGSR